MTNKLRCFVIGEDSLLIKCCETLLEKEHTILGIAASNLSIRKWAKEKTINVYELNSSLGKELTSKTYDYLFSITNLSVLPDEIINSPKVSAINFHDGPLPKFAGINATSWALMNQEKRYAITWHEITSEVDKGDILKQVEFDIEDGEIALSLNAKCFEAGASAFEELVDELANSTVKRIKQDFSKRSYFGKYKRPVAAALIDWNNDAEKILSFVHALNFGRYRNPLGLPKVKVGEKFFIIPEIEITNTKSGKVPGTITSSNDNNIQVSTKTNDVKISKVLSIDGTQISISNLVEQFSLKTGFNLNQIDSETSKSITDINSSITKKEDYWVKELTGSELINISYAKRNSGTDNLPKYVEENLSIDKKVFSSFSSNENQVPAFVTSLFSIFIGRHSGKNNFSLGFSNTELINNAAKVGNLFADFVPVKIDFNPEESIGSITKKIVEKLADTSASKTFVKDIFVRYPELHPVKNESSEPVYPVAVVFVDSKSEVKPQDGSVLTFAISSDLKDVKFIFDSNSIDQEDFRLMKSQFSAFIDEAAAHQESAAA
ncbi:MAG: formyltransferase family protein, partial [Ignavibacteriales bacterium]